MSFMYTIEERAMRSEGIAATIIVRVSDEHPEASAKAIVIDATAILVGSVINILSGSTGSQKEYAEALDAVVEVFTAARDMARQRVQ
jgi:hypothetical protein